MGAAMSKKWTWGVLVGVILSWGCYQVTWADTADIKRRLDEGQQAYSAGNYPEALAKWQQGLELAQKSANQKAMAVFGANLGLVYRNLGQFEKALVHYQQVLALDRELKDTRSEGSTLGALALIHWRLGQYDQAVEYYQQALAIHRELKNRQAEGSNLSNLGMVYWNLSQYGKALEYYQQALSIHRDLKNRQAEGITLGNMGMVFNFLGHYDQALGYCQQALAISRELKDRQTEGANLTTLGIVHDNLAQYDEAQAYYQQALTIYRETRDRRGEAANLGNLGMVSENLGQYDQTLEYYHQALALQRDIREHWGEGNTLGNLGRIWKDLGQDNKALEYFQQALAIQRQIKDRRGEGASLGNLGIIYVNLGQYDRALEYFQQALAIDREVKDRRGEGHALGNLGLVYGRLGQHDRALKYHQETLAIRREIKDRLGEGSALGSLARIYGDLGQLDKALEASKESLKISQEVGAPDSLWRAQRGLGAVEVKIEKYGAAIKHYRQAIDTIEGLRGGLRSKEVKISFMQDKLFMYDELIELLRSLHEKDPTKGYDREALEIFERKQGRLFLEEMGQSGARTFTGLPEQMRNQETALEQRLDKLQADLVKEWSQPQPDPQRLRSLENELQQARAAFQALKSELQTTYPDYYALKYPQPTKLAELQAKVLNPGEVMLVYGVMKDMTCLWVIGKEVCRLHTLPIGGKGLGRKIAAFRQRVLEHGEAGRGVASQQEKTEKTKNTLSQELYNLLIPAQARPPLSPGSSLYIIPTGPLYSLPFEALEAQASGQPPRYLVEDYAIVYLSSASLLKTLREARARKQAQPPYPLLAFANPRYGKGSYGQAEDKSVRSLQTRAYLEIMGGGFPELPETEDEVREIKDLLQAPEQSNPLQLKEAASRSTVFSLNQSAKLPDYRYLVFACHGILPGEVDRVVQPALVLSHPEQDGYLTMGDVFGLKLNAQLVSLSACNTGRGAEVKGEGVIGLTRAFMYAGTPAVSVTLWSIESQSAKELNVGMYRYLCQNHGRSASLREIKLSMLRGEKGDEYRHPFFWAPLVIFGDGQ
jgi:tetratricopeptide (TPR) repeat protein